MVDKWSKLSNQRGQTKRVAEQEAKEGKEEEGGTLRRFSGHPVGLGGGPMSRLKAVGANDGEAAAPPSGDASSALAEALLRLLSLVDSSQVSHTSPHT